MVADAGHSIEYRGARPHILPVEPKLNMAQPERDFVLPVRSQVNRGKVNGGERQVHRFP
jgi:hypothetical protein